ncbi:MAG: hypothetical protein LBB45_02345 [Methanobrevibacter sp.]|jgi:hypothetical protein|nr:hypothetical protein [Candidatus Methanovirga basalitermitum]
MTNNKKGLGVCNIRDLHIDPDKAPTLDDKQIKELADIYEKYDCRGSVIANKGEVIYGHDKLYAAKKSGANDISVCKVDLDKKSSIICSLRLERLRKRFDPIWFSNNINLAIAEGATRKEIRDSLNISKGWLSKIENLNKNLTENVIEMSRNGTLSHNTATIISKIPERFQNEIASYASQEQLNSDQIKFIANYCAKNEVDDDSFKKLMAEAKYSVGKVTPKIRKKRNQLSKQNKICDLINLIIKSIDKLNFEISEIDQTNIAVKELVTDLDKKMNVLNEIYLKFKQNIKN